jgi:CRISPR-associated endonuclease/helicase Cas3
MMENNPDTFFRTFFRFLNGNEPFEWQKEVFHLLIKGEIPPIIDIPTGCGKTALMEIWVSALAWQALGGEVSLPRRLVWIVNRRTVVDQATEAAEEIKKKLESLKETRKEIYEALKNLSLTGESRGLIAVSTLRGELADNEEWKKDPTRPSIIVGTVDMIGSKLLFRGYGDGPWHRSLHAGLLGVDSIVVHDESHLTPAFTKLLANLLELRSKFSFPKRFFVINLSATPRDGSRSTLSLPLVEDPSPELRKRIFAEKSLYLHEVPESEKLKQMVELALRHEESGARILIYITSPEDATKLRNEIAKKVGQERVGLLTGEMRGYERDCLIGGDKLYQEFRMGRKREIHETLYLVSTAAGEVGININADHCVCDLAPVDHLIQRLGRVNRDGSGKARVDLVFSNRDIDAKKNLGVANAKTLEYLKRLSREEGSIDVSPVNLRRNPPPADAFSPEPAAPILTPDIVDLWSLTSIPLATLDSEGERKVEFWLHGKEEEPQTHVIWREDVKWLIRLEGKETEINKALQAYRPITREMLTVRTDRLKDFLKKVVESKDVKEEYKKAILIREDKAEVRSLGELTDEGEELAFSTLFLPCEIGGLSEAGTLAEDRIGQSVKDVADGTVPFLEVKEGLEWADKRRRYYARYDEEKEIWEIRELGSGEVKEWEDLNEFLKKIKGHTTKVVLSKDEPTGEEVEILIYLGESWEEDYASGKDVPLERHRADVKQKIEGIITKLNLPEEIVRALREAAEIHDLGKDDDRWQEAIGNLDRKRGTLAKSSTRRFDWRACQGYRHELGSVAKALSSSTSTGFSDLSLHLEATTHGYGRPSFPDGALEEMGEHVYGQMKRFAELQRRFGWWELAYLEALLKCADVLASEEERK